MKKRSLIVLSFIATLLLNNFANAGVSLKNGNFFIGYSDLVFSGGLEPKIERVYNSKSSYNGFFGFGWGSDYETHLKISADGSVVMYENGGGSQNRFTPPNMSKADVEKAVDEIIAIKQKSGLSGSALAEEKNRLLTDARYRNDVWQSLYEKKLVKSRELKPGTILTSAKFNYQTLTYTGSGYIRNFENGQVQTFDKQGKLIKWADKNNNYLVFSYDQRGMLSQIRDNFNRTIKLFFNAQGHLEKAVGDGGKVAEYKYNGDELVYSKDAANNEYRYRYSQNQRHNLVEIKYTDNTTFQLGYHDLNKCENVKWVKERDNTVTQYDYTGDCNGGLEHATIVTVRDSEGKEISKTKYTYIEKVKADGERYTYKLIEESDGVKTETTYNECCGLPLEIVRNGEKTSFTYDTYGHVIKKITPTEVTELTYGTKSKKVEKVVKYSKSNPNEVSWVQYTYDDKGNLMTAKNNEGKAVRLVYDHQGRIQAMIDHEKRQLTFVYNEANRPVEIKDPQVGSIKVQYNSYGDIVKVDSAGGRTVASKVTMAFQNLIDLIRPAGVNLGF
jgi:YD repeat-containing protein